MKRKLTSHSVILNVRFLLHVISMRTIDLHGPSYHDKIIRSETHEIVATEGAFLRH